MKKSLLFFLFLSWSLMVHSQQNYIIELLTDNVSISPEDTVLKSDVKWSLKNLRTNGVMSSSTVNYSLWNSDAGLVLIIDLKALGNYDKNDQLEIVFTITNPQHKFYNYAGKRKYTVTQLTQPEAFYGIDGINLSRKPFIFVKDTTICKQPGIDIQAIVRNAPVGYKVKWTTLWLSALPGDKARLDSVPLVGASLNLSAVLTYLGDTLDIANFTLNFDSVLAVNIVENDYCLAAGERYELHGTIPQNSDSRWDVYNIWETLRALPTPFAVSQQTVNSGEMPANDIKAYLTVTSAMGCENRDSVYIYLGPEKLAIRIDTNLTRNDIKISWDTTALATGYKLMSNKWDGYAVSKAYTKEQSWSTSHNAYTINTADLDTLKFFYVVGERSVNETTCSSVSSDTVGYFKQSLKVSSKGAINLISYPFDMTGEGIFNAGDLLDKIIGSKECSMNKFDLATQSWISCFYDAGFPPQILPSWENNFMLQSGQVYQVDVDMNRKLLLYGKLPSKFVYNLATGPGGMSNFVLVSLSFPGYNILSLIGDSIPNVNSISLWDISMQRWSQVSKFNIGGKGEWFPEPGVSKLPLLHSWMPIKCTVNSPTQGWSK